MNSAWIIIAYCYLFSNIHLTCRTHFTYHHFNSFSAPMEFSVRVFYLFLIISYILLYVLNLILPPVFYIVVVLPFINVFYNYEIPLTNLYYYLKIYFAVVLLFLHANFLFVILQKYSIQRRSFGDLHKACENAELTPVIESPNINNAQVVSRGLIR